MESDGTYPDKNDDRQIITVRHERTGEWKRTTWGNLMNAYTLLQHQQRQMNDNNNFRIL